MNQLLFYLAFTSSLSSLDHRPRICDSDILPSAENCTANLEFNRQYLFNLTKQQSFYMERDPRWEIYQRAIKETEYLEHAWSLLATIQNNRKWGVKTWATEWQKDQLQKLRKMLGDDDFFNGRMLPVIPFWRFREIE